MLQLFINDALALTSEIKPGRDFPTPIEPRITLMSLERGYEKPAELTFRVNGDWRAGRFTPGSIVRLEQNDDTIFHGLLDPPRVVCQVGQPPRTEYTAVDFAAIHRDATSVPDGWTTFRVPGGSIDAVIAALLVHVGGTLEGLGFDSPAAIPGSATGIQCPPLVFAWKSIDECMRIIAAACQGVKVFVEPNAGKPRYRFCGLFAGPVATVVLDGDRVPAIDIGQSLEGRAGAVQLNDQRVSGTGAASATQNLLPDWSNGDEQAWRISDWMQASGADETGRAAVARRFTYATAIPERSEIIAEFSDAGVIGAPWRRIAIAKHDRENQVVLLAAPALADVNEFKAVRRSTVMPGQIQVATVRLRYTTNSGSITVPGQRWPVSGFTGTVVALDPLRMSYVKRIEAPTWPGIDRARYARDAWAVYSEPATRGQAVIVGMDAARFGGLDQRINLTTGSAGLTGYESLRAPLMSARIEFEEGGRTTLSFDSDKESLLVSV